MLGPLATITWPSANAGWAQSAPKLTMTGRLVGCRRCVGLKITDGPISLLREGRDCSAETAFRELLAPVARTLPGEPRGSKGQVSAALASRAAEDRKTNRRVGSPNTVASRHNGNRNIVESRPSSSPNTVAHPSGSRNADRASRNADRRPNPSNAVSAVVATRISKTDQEVEVKARVVIDTGRF